MQQLPSRNYSLTLVGLVLIIILWGVADSLAASTHPGLLAPFRRQVWCHTIIDLADEGDKEGRLLFVNHYPRKKLKRVLEDMEFRPGAIPLLLEAEKKTQCFYSWREAAISDVRIGQMIQEYAAIMAHWSEAQFREAVLMVTFQENGLERLRAALFRQDQQQRQEATTP